MIITYDKEVDAAYIQLIETEQRGEKDGKIKATDSFEIKNIIPFGDVNINFNEENKILGFEILNASRYLPEKKFYSKQRF